MILGLIFILNSSFSFAWQLPRGLHSSFFNCEKFWLCNLIIWIWNICISFMKFNMSINLNCEMFGFIWLHGSHIWRQTSPGGRTLSFFNYNNVIRTPRPLWWYKCNRLQQRILFRIPSCTLFKFYPNEKLSI